MTWCAQMSSNPIDFVDLDALSPALLRALRGLRFGSVEIVVHDGRVVQIERRERVRFDSAGRRPPDTRGRVHDNDHRTDRSPGGSDMEQARETTE
jgi:hypothetical protein